MACKARYLRLYEDSVVLSSILDLHPIRSILEVNLELSVTWDWILGF
jgi:hypothetical protein